MFWQQQKKPRGLFSFLFGKFTAKYDRTLSSLVNLELWDWGEGDGLMNESPIFPYFQFPRLRGKLMTVLLMTASWMQKGRKG